MKSIIFSILLLTLLTSCGNTTRSKSNIINNGNSESTHNSVSNDEIMIFEKKTEPNENAFSLLIPKNWQIQIVALRFVYI